MISFGFTATIPATGATTGASSAAAGEEGEILLCLELVTRGVLAVEATVDLFAATTVSATLAVFAVFAGFVALAERTGVASFLVGITSLL